MRILFTGNYLPQYNRTAIIRKGLVAAGLEIVEFPFSKPTGSIKKSIIEKSQACDLIFMPSFTHKEVPYVRSILGPKKDICFDPLISRYLTKIFDYKIAFKFGISALRNFYRDKRALERASFVFTDTDAHRDYFHNTFKIPMSKMGVLYIGNDFSNYYPEEIVKLETEKFRVGFYGGFIPLQGALNILSAAKILKDVPDIEFYMIGTGFEYEKAKKFVAQNQLKNVILPGWVDEQRLPHEINKFDIALGIFGETEKSDLVIPNKVYHYGACGRPVITKKSPAIIELFKHGENIWLTGTHPDEIARDILHLKAHEQVRSKLGINMYTLLRDHYSAEKVGQHFLKLFHDYKATGKS